MAAAGWYPDPGGGRGLFRYWDGKAWSAATTTQPTGAPPDQPLGAQPQQSAQSFGGYAGGSGTAYAQYQQLGKRKPRVGWWVAAAVVVVAVIVVGVLVVRSLSGGGNGPGGPTAGQPSQDVCPASENESPSPVAPSTDGRVHGGPVSYPQLGSPWRAPAGENRVAFGTDVKYQDVVVQDNYDNRGHSWVASVLVGELNAGDGFFTPEQGSQIVVKCIIGKFYGDAEVKSDVKVNRAARIDGHDAWLVESHLSFDIKGLDTKGELLIVAIVSAGGRSGLYYASIPDTVPELIRPAREALAALKVTE